jgi:hypothetical protein
LEFSSANSHEYEHFHSRAKPRTTTVWQNDTSVFTSVFEAGDGMITSRAFTALSTSFVGHVRFLDFSCFFLDGHRNKRWQYISESLDQNTTLKDLHHTYDLGSILDRGGAVPQRVMVFQCLSLD